MPRYILRMLNARPRAPLTLAHEWPVRSASDHSAIGGVRRLLTNWPDDEAAEAILLRERGTIVERWDIRRIPGRPVNQNAAR
jgi:hypothetical protein